MDKNAINKYAVWARRELIQRVSQRAQIYGISAGNPGDPDAESISGHLLSQAEKRQRQALIQEIQEKGFDQVMEEVAYTWFNRFAALRFMEVNGYLPSHIRVFTNDAEEFRPQILAEAIHLELDGLDMNKVYELEDANKSEELFKYTELLLPDYLLREGSVIEQMVTTIPEEDWTDQVQIIGWLYQYYISEKKDDVFADLKKNIKITKENIPAATQLFTPDWIVQYMVQNSLGRLWLEGHPNDALKATWKYYLDEAEQEPAVQAKLAEIRKEYAGRKPEDIRVIDPCCGSGHILCVLFDVLVQIYEDYGYPAREAAQSIVRHNLYGLDIDPRAAQLSYFAVMMKARQYDSRFLTRNIQPQIYAPTGYPEGEEYGSLIRVEDLEPAPDFDSWTIYDGDYDTALNRWNFRHALSQQYDVVVTNPPYMGGNNMNSNLSLFVKRMFPDSKNDMFAVFMERIFDFLKSRGYEAMITQQVWMFTTRYEKFRNKLNLHSLICMLHLGANAFAEINGEVVQTTSFVFRKGKLNNYRGTYFRLTDPNSEDGKKELFLDQINNNDTSRVFSVSQSNYESIPGNPYAYWASENVIKAFQTGISLGSISKSTKGIITGDNGKYMRLWWEIEFNRIHLHMKDIKMAIASRYKWFPCTKGGDYRKWYGNKDYIMDWQDDGYRILKLAKKEKRNSQDYYSELKFKPGLSWSVVATSNNSFRFETDNLIEHVGMATFPQKEHLLFILGLLNSNIVSSLLRFLSPTIVINAGEVDKIPVISAPQNVRNRVNTLVEKCIRPSQQDWDSFETSWDFQRHPLVQPGTATVAEAFAWWESECNARFTQLKSNEEELNRIFIDIYGLQDELTPEVADKDVTVRKANLQRDIKSLLSYAVGCMFGRYSLDKPGLVFAGGEFDDVYWRHKGQAALDEYGNPIGGGYAGISLAQYCYPRLHDADNWQDATNLTYWPDADNIIPICDDEYFEDDIVGRFVRFIEITFSKFW